MSEVCNITATIDNQTQYALTFDTNSTVWGYFSDSGTGDNSQVPANSQLQVFTAWGAEGSGTGCQGQVTYTFTDQNNNPQDITLFYKDPYTGDNAFSATVPGGLSCTNNGPTHGDTVSVIYTISGTVS